MNAKVITNVILRIPPKKALDTFVGIATPLRELICQRVRESSRLSAMRSALLPVLLSGRTRLTEAQELVKAAS
jgi:hypothetical protein